jgi:hypothetical protein
MPLARIFSGAAMCDVFQCFQGENMSRCEACGNDYDKAFQVIAAGKTYTFDSFECAIHTLAPKCAHCGVKIIGHGLEQEGTMFCCAHCAEHQGATQLRDRV